MQRRLPSLLVINLVTNGISSADINGKRRSEPKYFGRGDQVPTAAAEHTGAYLNTHTGRNRSAGPAGLILSHLLHLQAIDSVVVEIRSRQYVEERVRAGILTCLWKWAWARG